MAYAARPVPQNIMSVEFKLFDFMTLKQFMISFGLLLLSFILFFLLPAPWKILVPLMIVIFGGIIIFVPFNGEPFQEFVGSYLEAMISPQRRIWNKKGVIVQSAYSAAKRYQFGNDPKDDKNDFRFNNAQTVKIGDDQTGLDTEESKFLHENGQNGNPSYVPPQKKADGTVNVMEQNGTRVSPRSVQANVNLDQLPENKEQIAPLQNQVQSQEPQHPEVTINIEKPAQEPSIEFNQRQNQPQQQEHQTQISINLDNTAQVEQKTPEPQIQTTQKREDPSQIVSKNYIFGNIEDQKGEGILGAYISIQQNNNELENIFSNAGGDFQTHYEYPYGEYTLEVVVDGKPFNNLLVHHDPIDPVPITIRSKYIVQEEQPQVEELPNGPAFNEDGVFVGSYDSNTFNLGQDYHDLQEPEDIFLGKNNTINENTLNETTEQHYEIAQEQVQAPSFLLKESALPTQETPPPQAESIDINIQPSQPTQTYHQVNQELVQAQIEASAEPEPEYTQDFAQNIISSAENLDYITPSSQQEFPAPFSDQNIQLTDEVLNPSYTQITNEIDFKILPDAVGQMDLNLAGIPNTVNGIIYDSTSMPLGSVLINVYDGSGKVVRTIASTPQGEFYSYSPFPNGKYHLEFIRQGYLFMRYYVDFKGYPVAPKTVQSIQNVP